MLAVELEIRYIFYNQKPETRSVY